MSRKIRKTALTSVVTVIATLIAAWTVSLIKCEILTDKYYSEFSGAYRQNTMLADEIEYFKVLDCSENSAEVFYVSEGKSSANLLNFTKQNDEWVQTDWETVWSSSGSASGAVFPYWWHFIYGGL